MKTLLARTYAVISLAGMFILLNSCQKEISAESQKEIPLPVNGLAAINVLYAKLDDANEAIVDSKKGNNGIARGITYSASGLLNTALSAPSRNASIDYGSPSALNLTHTGSVSTWVNFGSVSGAPGIVSKCNFNADRHGYALSLQDSHPYFEICNGTTANFLTLSSVTVTTSTWYHFVFTWDGSNIYGYVDGSLIASTAQTIDATHEGGFHLTMFSAYNGTDYGHFFLDGTLDEVSIFNDALSPTQVTTLYNSGIPLAFSRFN